MSRNVGLVDRVVCLVFGGTFLVTALSRSPAVWWGLLGIVPIAIGILGYSPLYHVLGISTAVRAAARRPRSIARRERD